MHLTAKSRYALQIMLELAGSSNQAAQRQAISSNNNIPLDYMDQILARLKRAGLIGSKRGPHGGVGLQQSPYEITLWNIFESVEDNLSPVRCLEKHDACQLEGNCLAQNAWADAFSGIKESLNKKILGDYLKPQHHVVEAISKLQDSSLRSE